MVARRTRAIAGVVLLAIAVAVYLLWPRSEHEAAAPRDERTPAPAARTEPANPAPSIAAPDPFSAPSVPAGAPPITLPPDTQMLAEEFVPGTTEWEEVPLLEETNVVLRFVPEHYNVFAPDPIVLFLEVVDNGKRIAAGTPHARLRSSEVAGDDGWIDIAMIDDGSHRYVARYTPKPQDKLFGHVVAEGVVTMPKAGTRRIPQALIYTRGPRAHLTGRWRDEARDGHLYLSAEIVVDERVHDVLDLRI